MTIMLNSFERLVVFNWKMNPQTLAESDDIFDEVKKISSKMKQTGVVICPPIIFLDHIAWSYKGKKMTFGVQDAFYEESGSWTGQVSYPQSINAGASVALINHSERKKVGELKEIARKKMDCALKNDMSIVLCIGEDKRDDRGIHLRHIEDELRYFLKSLSSEHLDRVVLAYEPIWAIGKASSATPHEVHEMSLYIKKKLIEMFGVEKAKTIKLLYGGSVDDTNAQALMQTDEIDGFLIGRASLDPRQSEAILSVVDKYITQ